MLLMHELWEEQIERVRQGLDPVGVVREADDRLIPVPGDQQHVDWEAGMRLFDRSLDERTRQVERRLAEAIGRRHGS